MKKNDAVQMDTYNKLLEDGQAELINMLANDAKTLSPTFVKMARFFASEYLYYVDFKTTKSVRDIMAFISINIEDKELADKIKKCSAMSEYEELFGEYGYLFRYATHIYSLCVEGTLANFYGDFINYLFDLKAGKAELPEVDEEEIVIVELLEGISWAESITALAQKIYKESIEDPWRIKYTKDMRILDEVTRFHYGKLGINGIFHKLLAKAAGELEDEFIDEIKEASTDDMEYLTACLARCTGIKEAPQLYFSIHMTLYTHILGRLLMRLSPTSHAKPKYKVCKNCLRYFIKLSCLPAQERMCSI